MIDGAVAGTFDTGRVGFNSLESFSGLDIGLDRGSPVSHYEAPFFSPVANCSRSSTRIDPMQQLDYETVALMEMAWQ